MFNNLKADIRRYVKSPRGRENIYVIFEQGMWAVAVYRFGRWARGVRIPVVSLILRMAAFLLFKMTEILTGISLPASAQIGKGLYAGHFGPTILHSHVKMGENCSIGPGVVIGTRGMGDTGTPVIGDNVYAGTGCKILGSVKIGNNVKIGANAVVLTDIPDGATAVGVQARIIPAGSEGTAP